MYALGIPVSQYRRCTQVLGHEASEPINYEDEKHMSDNSKKNNTQVMMVEDDKYSLINVTGWQCFKYVFCYFE